MPSRLSACLPLTLLALAAAPAKAATLADAAGRYTIVQAGSEIAFSIDQIAGPGIRARFGQFSGTIDIDAKDVSRSRVSIVIVPGSVTAANSRVENFLRSDAVFDARNEKRITFRSTSVKRVGEDGAQVAGVLTARGRTAQERFNVRLRKLSKGSISFHVTGRVLRSRYGMDVGTPIYSNVVDFDMTLAARRN